MRKTRHPAAKDPRPDSRNRSFTPSLDAKNPGRRTRPTVDEDILSEVVAAYPTQAIVLEESGVSAPEPGLITQPCRPEYGGSPNMGSLPGSRTRVMPRP